MAATTGESAKRSRGRGTMNGMATHARKRIPLRPWQLWLAVAVMLALTAALVAAAGASSYDNLWHLAVAHRVPLPRVNPLELDCGLVVVTLLDIVLTWAGYPFGPLRLLARLLGAGTVAANVAGGWPDPAGSFLRGFAPAVIVIITEAVRALLLQRDEEYQRARRRHREEKIPRARWLLAPASTFALWRRMKLWRVAGYGAALDMEISRRRAIVRLGMKYGAGWETAAPADLVWMLRHGVKMAEALVMVADLTAPVPDPAPAVIAPAPAAKRAPRSDPGSRKAGRRSTPAEVLSTELKAFQLLEDHPELRQPRMGAELARRLGIHPSYGGKLHRRLTARDRAPESGTDRSRERSGIAHQDRSES